MPQTLSLTFDDGPDEHWSSCMVSALRQCRVRGTFFMVGERVRELPTHARAVIEAGNEVQLHCHRHIRHTDLSELEIELDTREALSALADVGVHPTYWRTPWGVQTPASARVAERHRLRLVRWTIDTHDWRGDPAWLMLERAREQLRGGSVVLMHDGLGPGASRSGCENTVELLKPLVAAASSAGLEVGALGDAATGAGAGAQTHQRATIAVQL